MKKTILALLMLMLLVPACALAAVSVVDSSNHPVLPNSGKYNLGAGSYTLSGSSTTGISIEATGSTTLNLNGLSIDATAESGLSITGSSGAAVKIVPGSAASSITGWKYGVYTEIPMTIDGSGTLNVKSYRNSDGNNSGRCAIKATANLTIASGTVNASILGISASARGIDTNGTLTISGGTVTASGQNAAIYANGNIAIQNATVVADHTEAGIYSYTGTVSITGSNVQANGSFVPESGYAFATYGIISSKGTSIAASDVLAVGGTKAVSGSVTGGNDTLLSHKDSEDDAWETLTDTQTSKKMLRAEFTTEKTPTPAPEAGTDTTPTPAPEAGTDITPTPAPEAGTDITPTPAPEAGMNTPTPAPIMPDDNAESVPATADRQPKTGDSSNLALWAGLMIICGAVLSLKRRHA